MFFLSKKVLKTLKMTGSEERAVGSVRHPHPHLTPFLKFHPLSYPLPFTIFLKITVIKDKKKLL